MDTDDLRGLVSLLEQRNKLLAEKERELADRNEELSSQQEELTAAIEELNEKNKSLLVALENLQQRNSELDQILYRASHDLRTPVSSIVGLLGLLKSDGLKPSQLSTFQHLQQKTFQMQTLLDSLTMLAQASFDNINPKSVDVVSLVNEVKSGFSSFECYQNVDVLVNVPNDSNVIVDGRLLRIILTVLLSNAFTYRNPTVRGKIAVSLSLDQHNMLLEISDDGEGIPQAIANRVFEMFYRGSERSTGSGLGLYILQRIVQRLDGNVSFASKPGATTFSVRLPHRP